MARAKTSKAPTKRFEQLPPMFDIGPVVQRHAEVVEEVFPVDEMVSTSIHRANTKAEMYEASRVALEAYKQAIEAAPFTGIFICICTMPSRVKIAGSSDSSC